jgi:hypothetical protein
MTTLKRYKIGTDFTEEQYHKWVEQLTWWIGEKMHNIESPKGHAEKALLAAMNGTKMDGSPWPLITNDFNKRIKQLVGFDLEAGIGIRDPMVGAKKSLIGHTAARTKTAEIPPVDLKEAMGLRKEYISNLLGKYPHLDSPVYKPKVEELAETIVKSRMISSDFLNAQGVALERLSKIRESLHKQIGELMEFLEISPKQRVRSSIETKNADVGSLVAKMESYGASWEEFERLDALRELLQFYHMLQSTRPDGTPQLNDWELWHLTRNRPVQYKCISCGWEVELLGGFTPLEIEQALVQAQKVYGFGLEEIGETLISSGTGASVIDLGFIVNEEMGQDNDSPSF